MEREVEYHGVREVAPIIGRREFRYPSELTMRPDVDIESFVSDPHKYVRLRFSEGGDEAFYLTAKMEALEDGLVRFFDIRAVPTPAQAKIEFVRTEQA